MGFEDRASRGGKLALPRLVKPAPPAAAMP
jgi:hypothetical protein